MYQMHWYEIDFTLRSSVSRTVHGDDVGMVVNRLLKELFGTIATLRVWQEGDKWLGFAQCAMHNGELPFAELEEIALTIKEGIAKMWQESLHDSSTVENVTVASCMRAPESYSPFPLAS